MTSCGGEFVIPLSYPFAHDCTRSILGGGVGKGRQVHAVVDGLPLHLHEQGGEGDGDVGEHEQGKGEHVHKLFDGRSADLVPFRDGGDAAQHQQRQAAVQHGFRRDGHIGFVVSLHAEDIDAILSADVQLTDAVPLPAVRDGDLDNGVLLVQLYVIEDVVGGVPDGRPLRQLLFRVCHRVRAVAQQKFCLYIPFGAGHHIFRPQLLEQGRRFQRVLEVSADGNVAVIIVSNVEVFSVNSGINHNNNCIKKDQSNYQCH